jgi:hypothetical protein
VTVGTSCRVLLWKNIVSFPSCYARPTIFLEILSWSFITTRDLPHFTCESNSLRHCVW